MWDFESAVIGGGPGGLMSSLYLRRFRRGVALFQAGRPRADWIPKTNNILGFPQGVSGHELLLRLNRHLLRIGIERFHGEARVTRQRGGFRIHIRDLTFTSRTVILATGFRDTEPELPNLLELRRDGLLRYCPICDAFDHRDQELAVLTQDNAGIQRALFLSRFTKVLKIVVPESLKLAPQRVRQIRECRGQVFRGQVLAIEKSRLPRGLWIDLDSGQEVFARYCYVELGCRVTDSAFHRLPGLKRTKEGFLITTTEQRTSLPGLFAVGDCVNLLGQISVAAGQAAVAATTIHNDLPE